MKRLKLITLTIILISTVLSQAQTVPNGDFENWSKGLPLGWGWSGSISQSTDHESGNYSLKMKSLNDSLHSFFNYVSLSSNYSGTIVIPKYLNGYIKSNMSDNDSLLIKVSTKIGNWTGYGVLKLKPDISTWIPFHVSMVLNNYGADSFIVPLGFYGTTQTSYFLIDNLFFSDTPIGNEVGVDNIEDTNDKILIYPNPVIKEINIFNQLHSLGTVQLYDLTGRLLKAVITDDTKISIDLSDLNNGIYFISIIDKILHLHKKFL